MFTAGDHRSRKRWFTRQTLELIDAGLDPVRVRFGPSNAQMTRVFLRYCLQRAPNAAVLAGFTRPWQVEWNLTGLGAPLTVEELELVRTTTRALHQALDASGEVFLDEYTLPQEAR